LLHCRPVASKSALPTVWAIFQHWRRASQTLIDFSFAVAVFVFCE
jgi:hypothetical protein